MNVSPSPVKDMKLGYVTPLQNILVAEQGNHPAVNVPPKPQVNLEACDLSPAERQSWLTC